MMALQRMKPWLVAITLMAPTLQAAGFKPELGVDRHFFDRAKASGMKRQALETLAYQLDRFDQLSPKLQEDLLKTTMEDLDAEVAGVREMAQAWSFGNVAAMEKMTLAALQGVARALHAAAGRAQHTTGSRTSTPVSRRRPAASSWSAPPIWSDRTACRRSLQERATGSRSNKSWRAMCGRVRKCPGADTFVACANDHQFGGSESGLNRAILAPGLIYTRHERTSSRPLLTPGAALSQKPMFFARRAR